MFWVGDVVAGERIACGAGATWRAVLARTLPRGLVPRVVPSHLDPTVGGTISVGGIGSTSHRFGAAASNIDALTVVVGSGDQVWCDATRHAGSSTPRARVSAAVP
jgi:cytokinin dehydrogenase